MLTSNRNIDLARAVILAVAQQDAGRDLTTRQVRGVEIAATLGLRQSGKRGGWKVASQSSGDEYFVRSGCTCPDDYECKHLYAVRYVSLYARSLCERLCGEWSQSDFDGDAMALIADLEADYESLVASAAAYEPPASGLLHSFRLEAIGDDAVAARRMCEVRGQVFTPPRVSDLDPAKPWAARITGLCPQYEFRREFQRGHKEYRDANKRGSRGVYLYYELPPGIYEVQELLTFDKQRRYFATVENLTMIEISKTKVLQCLSQNERS